MRVIIFGLGSIGSRHARIIKKNFDANVYAFRSRKQKSANSLGIPEISSWKEVEKLKARVAYITNPTALHIETALKCAKLGMHLFIEKPLSHRLKGIEGLAAVVKKKRLTCYTAYCLRFHPVIKKIKVLLNKKEVYHVRICCSSYLPEWRKTFDIKRTYSSLKKKGGGVILDLSHEFDYIEYLFGEITAMKGVFAKTGDVTLDSEDFADVFLKVKNRIPVNLHINFLSRICERSIKIDFKEGYLIGDLVRNLVLYRYRGKEEKFSFTFTDNDLFEAQASYFFRNLKNPWLMNNLNESRRLLRKILNFKKGRQND